jgi:hypothetical protein
VGGKKGGVVMSSNEFINIFLELSDRKKVPEKRASCARIGLSRTEFWRGISWHIGDVHADRICKMIDAYCWIFGLDQKKFHQPAPR